MLLLGLLTAKAYLLVYFGVHSFCSKLCLIIFWQMFFCKIVNYSKLYMHRQMHGNGPFATLVLTCFTCDLQERSSSIISRNLVLCTWFNVLPSIFLVWNFPYVWKHHVVCFWNVEWKFIDFQPLWYFCSSSFMGFANSTRFLLVMNIFELLANNTTKCLLDTCNRSLM